MNPTHDELLACALAAADAGAKVLADRFGGARRIEHKGKIDLVTDADQAAEEAVLAVIAERFPDHAILAEEGGASGTSPYRWIVDPLDGTTNYAHGIPQFCTSVACEVNGRLEIGVIVDPMRGERFTAATGQGAFLNGRKLQVTGVTRLDQAVLATGFPYWVHDHAEEVLDLFGAFLQKAQALRRFGSAALDLAWVAAGRYDGFFELKLKPWDVAAGVVLVQEAGGMVTALDGGAFDLQSGDTLAAGGALHPEMVPVANAGRARWT